MDFRSKENISNIELGNRLKEKEFLLETMLSSNKSHQNIIMEHNEKISNYIRDINRYQSLLEQIQDQLKSTNHTNLGTLYVLLKVNA